MIQYLHDLIRGDVISYDEKSKIISSLHNPKIRDTVADYFRSINSPRQVENLESLRTLGEILKYSLTAFVHEMDENYKLVYAILHSSQHVFHVRASDLQRTFLTYLLNDHGIWQERQVWKVCI